jgi:MFS family permease
MTHPASHPRKSAGTNGVLVLLGLSIFINYIDRANLSVAAPLLRNELALSATQLGVLLSAFFWTYACMQPIAGWLADRFDVKWVFAIGFFAWSAATAVTGLVHAFAALLVMRVLLGIGESVAYPCYCKIFATHFVEHQRGVANAVIGAGQALGPGLGMLFGGALVARFGWRPFFIGLGVVSLLWLAPWLRWMPPTGGHKTGNVKQGPAILEIISQRPAWGTWIGHFCANYPLYFLLTWLPLYLVEERGFSLNTMARIGGSTFLMAAASCLFCGWLSDRWISSGATPTRVRKTFMVVGAICTGLFMAGAVLAAPILSVVLLVLAGASFGLLNSNLNAITQTLAGPHAAGRWMGMQNFVGNLAGWVAPTLTGLLVQRTGHFYWPFFITAAVSWVGAIDWLFLIGQVEPVIWRPELHTVVPQIENSFGQPTAPAP